MWEVAFANVMVVVRIEEGVTFHSGKCKVTDAPKIGYMGRGLERNW